MSGPDKPGDARHELRRTRSHLVGSDGISDTFPTQLPRGPPAALRPERSKSQMKQWSPSDEEQVGEDLRPLGSQPTPYSVRRGSGFRHPPLSPEGGTTLRVDPFKELSTIRRMRSDDTALKEVAAEEAASSLRQRPSLPSMWTQEQGRVDSRPSLSTLFPGNSLSTGQPTGSFQRHSKDLTYSSRLSSTSPGRQTVTSAMSGSLLHHTLSQDDMPSSHPPGGSRASDISLHQTVSNQETVDHDAMGKVVRRAEALLHLEQPKDICVPETGKPVREMTDEEFCKEIDWEARRRLIAHNTLRKETEGKGIIGADAATVLGPVEMRNRMNLNNDNIPDPSVLARARSASSAYSGAETASSHSSGSQTKRLGFFKSLSRRTSSEVLAPEPTAPDNSNPLPAPVGKKGKKTLREKLRIRKKSKNTAPEEPPTELFEQGERIIKGLEEEKAGWRRKEQNPVFQQKDDPFEREHHYDKTTKLLDEIGRLAIVSDTPENAARRELEPDEWEQYQEAKKGNKIRREATGADSNLPSTAMPLPSQSDACRALSSLGGAKLVPVVAPAAKTISGPVPAQPARQATVASGLARTGWVTEMARLGPKALQDVETLGYKAHLTPEVREGEILSADRWIGVLRLLTFVDVQRTERDKMPLLPENLRRHKHEIQNIMEKNDSHERRNELIHSHPDNYTPHDDKLSRMSAMTEDMPTEGRSLLPSHLRRHRSAIASIMAGTTTQAAEATATAADPEH
ncbi:hypothetical protein FN846DRAFT_887484 [Sphaerosporella brunnea]|uniref:Uncharacterized protein n=1 Tax=Sphaerosporella brunnea TaxID=1250544 RepID=A0A5J5F640_9PEZI|nr:hypothetical protein FN846DRAFT_887484 [Sphaerosporella brunnea]